MMTLPTKKWPLGAITIVCMSLLACVTLSEKAQAADISADEQTTKTVVSSVGRQLESAESLNVKSSNHLSTTRFSATTLSPTVSSTAMQATRQRIEALHNSTKQLTPTVKLSRSQHLELLKKQTVDQRIDQRVSGLNAASTQGGGDGNASLIYIQPGLRDFSIYEAYSHLYDDFDEDGFYQTFTVTFDADVYGFSVGEPADVYGELYLSRNGGPWEHFYSTDIFTIYGEAEDDSFEVLTTLAQGYKTDYYDVLIDLYEVGYEDIVATISSEDVDSLYALPLESSDRDAVYIEEEIIETEVIVSGGSTSGVMLILGLALLFMRRNYEQESVN
ncbi:choice-of-anchor H family protein [Shewanella donghaensis]|uniref:choice-of-anchor H family protein n=1 Tax=Shewanella donghaensis TaxID=238836 RepID=UPI001D057AA5|nr:choice-of-anchor H family protein [Shewanella donghaensis]